MNLEKQDRHQNPKPLPIKTFANFVVNLKLAHRSDRIKLLRCDTNNGSRSEVAVLRVTWLLKGMPSLANLQQSL